MSLRRSIETGKCMDMFVALVAILSCTFSMLLVILFSMYTSR